MVMGIITPPSPDYAVGSRWVSVQISNNAQHLRTHVKDFGVFVLLRASELSGLGPLSPHIPREQQQGQARARHVRYAAIGEQCAEVNGSHCKTTAVLFIRRAVS